MAQQPKTALTCENCGETFTSQEELDAHLAECVGEEGDESSEQGQAEDQAQQGPQQGGHGGGCAC
jgi:hypothetical protein